MCAAHVECTITRNTRNKIDRVEASDKNSL